jgi:hypothetical protein
MAYIGEQISIVEYRKLEEIKTRLSNTNQWMNGVFSQAKGVLNARFTMENLKSATNMLQSLPRYTGLEKYVNNWIVKSAKTDKAYAKMVKDRCERDNRFYKDIYSLPPEYVFNVFKEKAIRKNPTSFSFRFRDALVAFILDQQRGQGRH